MPLLELVDVWKSISFNSWENWILSVMLVYFPRKKNFLANYGDMSNMCWQFGLSATGTLKVQVHTADPKLQELVKGQTFFN